MDLRRALGLLLLLLLVGAADAVELRLISGDDVVPLAHLVLQIRDLRLQRADVARVRLRVAAPLPRSGEGHALLLLLRGVALLLLGRGLLGQRRGGLRLLRGRGVRRGAPLGPLGLALRACGLELRGLAHADLVGVQSAHLRRVLTGRLDTALQPNLAPFRVAGIHDHAPSFRGKNATLKW